MKKWITGLLCLLLLVLLPVLDTPAEAANFGTCGNNVVRWQLQPSTGTLTFSGYGEMGPVVNWSAQPDPAQVKHVVIKDGVKNITHNAFYEYKALETVTVGKDVVEIGTNAFFACSALHTVKLPEGLLVIDSGVFNECDALTHVEIPDSVLSIGTQAFFRCDNLTSVKMPRRLEYLGNGVFSECVSLKEMDLPNGRYKMYGRVFEGCTALERVSLSVGVENIAEYTFSGCTALKEVVIPNTVTKIEQYAFNGCSALTEVRLPDSLQKLENAFGDCSSLRLIAIPFGVETIPAYAFSGCKALETVVLSGSVSNVNEWAFPRTVKTVYADRMKPFVYWAGDELKEVFVDANFQACKTNEYHNHIFDYVMPVDPTCAAEGKSLGLWCTACGEVFAEIETVPATGTHTYVEGLCSVCGGKDPNYEGVIFTFTDVTEADWFYNPVKWALRTNVTSGISETVFGPYDSCTRAQVVTFLWAANGKPEPAGSEEPFEDVSESDWFYKPVLWAVENGITGGTSETTFSPNDPCTRAQVVTFLWADAGKPNSLHGDIPFNDTFVGDWFLGPVLWAVRNDITGGTGNGMFSPYATCTRGQVVTFLYKAYGTN